MIGESILRFSYGPASVLEIGWTFLGALGIAFAISALRNCIGDYRALKAWPDYLPGGSRDIIARRNIRNMIERTVIFWAILFVGVVALLSTPTNSKAGPSVYAVVLSGTFMFIELVLVGGSFWDRLDVHEVYSQIRTRRSDGLPPEIVPVAKETTP